MGRLSQGQQRRLHLAMQIATRPVLLICDEPTDHLSVSLVDDLTAALSETPAAVVARYLVSPNAAQLGRRVCCQVCWYEDADADLGVVVGAVDVALGSVFGDCALHYAGADSCSARGH